MMLRIAIVDDEKQVAEYIAKTTKQHAENNSIQTDITVYDSSVNFLKEYTTDKYDVVFLDIEMPEMNGDELSAKLTEIDSTILLVYVTNLCNDEVYTMLKYMPIGFLRKPFFEKEIDEMLITLSNKITAIKKTYLVSSGKQMIHVSLKNVLYIESERNYVYFHILNTNQNKNEIIKIRKKLDEIEKDIEKMGFIRIHSSILVNYRFIYSINKSSITLDNGIELPVSRSRESTLTSKFLYFSRGL